MTTQQNKMLYGLLNKTGLMKDKANLIYGITKGRSESSKDLSFEEARLVINYLQTQDKTTDGINKMRRKIISMAHEMHWHLPGTQKIDMERLNAWCEKYGYGKKKLNDYSYNELPALVSQFTKVYKDFIDKI
jgi:hypothetical protein